MSGRPRSRFDALPPISIVLLSHNHYDHCDLTTLGMLARASIHWSITPLGNGRLLRAAGMRRVEELDWWQSAQSLRRADHAHAGASLFCPRPVRPQPRTLGRVHADGRSRAYLLRGRYGVRAVLPRYSTALGAPIDLALLPIGAYEPRWFMQSVHMNPAEAVQAHLDLGASESIAMHFGTFQMTAEGIDEPVRALEEARRTRSVPASAFRILGFGESL